MATKRTSVRSEESMVTLDLQPFLVPISIFLSALMIALSIFLAGRSIAVSIDPDSVKSKQTADDEGTTTPPAAAPAPAAATTKTVSIDDDPITGNRDAKVAIVEFSDYECPFCKRHFQQTWPDIKKNYIDKGEVMLVYRDFVAVPGHDPAATKEAQAAECARDQGNDETYFKIHDKMFNTTLGNGAGLSDTQLKQLAGEVGVNGDKLMDCVNSGKFKDEVAKDQSDASTKYTIGGTPGFVIGTIDKDGNVTGTVISGAQPYATFEAAIKAALAK